MSSTFLRVGAVLAMSLVLAGGVRAQDAPADTGQTRLGVDRVGVYMSYTSVDKGRNGWELGGDLDLGSVITRSAHLLVEGNYLHADLDRNDALGLPIAGSFHDFSVGAALRVWLFRAGIVEPYIGAGVGVHFIGNDIDAAQSIEHEYTGTKIGGEYFGGVAVDISRDQRWAVYGEVRRVEVSPVSRTTYRLGLFVPL